VANKIRNNPSMVSGDSKKNFSTSRKKVGHVSKEATAVGQRQSAMGILQNRPERPIVPGLSLTFTLPRFQLMTLFATLSQKLKTQ
jgi:hypothetical protein